MSKYFVVILLLLNIGCIGYGLNCKRPSTTEQSNAYYGMEPVGDEIVKLKLLVELAIKSRLKDPYSARFSFRQPYKGWIIDAGNCQVAYGYVFTVYVNAKNSYGGYTGDKRYDYIFLNGKMKGSCAPGSYSGTNICVVID